MQVLKKIYPVFGFFISLLLIGIIFKLNNIYPFGDLSIAWCDTCQQTIPLFCEFKDVLCGKSDLWLSLENAGGMNFFGVYFFNLSSPFTYIIAFFEKSKIAVAVNIMVALKLALSSLTFGFWLKSEIKNASPVVVVTVSVLYAFSGWSLMYYQILSWLDTLYVFPLLLLGLKLLTEEKSPILYIVSLFACVLFHFYLSWAVIIFICLYASVYIILNKSASKSFAKNFIISSCVSALLSAVVIIPAFLQYLKSMRGGNVVQNLLNENFFPNLYTSLPTFLSLLIVFPFILSFAKNKKVEQFEILFLLLLFPVFIEPIAAAWQTYDYMAFPTRYGFITIAIGLTLATKGISNVLNESEKSVAVKKWVKIAVSCLAIVTAVVINFYSVNYYKVNKDNLTSYAFSLWGDENSLKSLLTYYVLPLVFSIAIYVLLKFKIIQKYAFYGVIALLCVAEVWFSTNVYMIAPSNDVSGFNLALELDGLIEDDDFYRVKMHEKYFDVNLIGAMGYNSITHYTSLNRESTMRALKELGYSSYWMETGSNGGTVFTDALLRHKYTVRRYVQSAYIETDNLSIIKNDLLFPTAFLISKSGKNQSDNTLPRWQIQDELFTRLTGKSGLYQDYKYMNLTNVSDLSEQSTAKARNDFKIVSQSGNGKITYEIQIVGNKSLYFDCFDEYSNALKEHTNDSISKVSVLKSGRKTTYYSYPTKSKNGVMYLGDFSNCKVVVEVYLQKDVYANSFGVFSVDNDLLKTTVNELIAGDFTVKKDKLSGKIVAKDGDYLFTSFLYDEGYKVKVNGKKANAFSLNGFLAIELKSGENIIEVDYFPSGLNFGIAVLFVGLITLALYLIFNKKINAFKNFDGVCQIISLCLGAVVILAIYLMPTALCLLGYIM